MVLYMSVYVLASSVSSVEYSVDEFGRKADSFNAVLSGTTTINGPAFLNGPVALGSSITGIDISDVSGLQNALDLKAPSASPIFTGTTSGITEEMIGLGNVDNTTDADKPILSATAIALGVYSQTRPILKTQPSQAQSLASPSPWLDLATSTTPPTRTSPFPRRRRTR